MAVTRRRFLQLGSLVLGTAALSPWKLRANTSTPDTSVIFIWLPGGPPHMETYDMKPDAPVEYRGQFRPIPTVVPGIQVCELLPLHAKVADRFTLIRSVAHQFADHGGGHKRFLTGRDPMSPVGFVNDHPMVGSMVAKMRDGLRRGVPNYVAGMDPGRDHIDVFSFGSAYLGPATHPFTVSGDPSAPTFKVPNLGVPAEVADQAKERVGLLERLDTTTAAKDASGLMGAIDVNRGRAMELMTSHDARKAFDLAREAPKVRERYGIHPWGQRCLLARRLVEHGASFVTMVLENPYTKGVPKEGVYNWDSHAVNCHLFEDAKHRFPIYDQCISALVEDLYLRGLDRKVLLIVTGEFGRTPRITYAKGTSSGVEQPGRDHWPQAMSILVAGGGMRTGQVVGSTNSKGEEPKDRPLTPNDLWATMFRHLDIDWQHAFPDPSGRPMPILPYGDPIAELT